MKLYAVTVVPLSGFGTPLKGDTIFGHFCWQAAYDPSLLNGDLDGWVARYPEQPFAIFSSAWPKLPDGRYALKRPDLPLSFLFKDESGKDKKARLSKRKEIRKRTWTLIGDKLVFSIDSAEYVTDEALMEILTNEPGRTKGRLSRFVVEFAQSHNAINRLTMTTGEGMFAPFSGGGVFYPPGTELVVFVLIDSKATDIERVRRGLDRIGRFGYGRDASTGYGRFSLGDHKSIPIPEAGHSNACYALSPVVPDKGVFKESFFTPFVRYGKHGDRLVGSGNPFKNPVIMADEGAVFVSEKLEIFQKPYMGKAVLGTSKALPQTVVQGYSLYLPFRLEA